VELMKDSLKLTLSTLKVASDAAEAHAWHPEQPTSSYQEELRTSSRTATVPGLGRLRGIAEKARGRLGQSPGLKESNTPKTPPIYPGAHVGRSTPTLVN